MTQLSGNERSVDCRGTELHNCQGMREVLTVEAQNYTTVRE